jgi:hypothetical protein
MMKAVKVKQYIRKKLKYEIKKLLTAAASAAVVEDEGEGDFNMEN